MHAKIKFLRGASVSNLFRPFELEWMFVLAQGIGVAGMIVSFMSFQSDKRKNILLMQCLASAIWGIHYVFLGAITAAGINFIEVTRNYIFSNDDLLRKPITGPARWVGFLAAKRPLIWAAIYVVIFVSVGAFTWQGPVDLLALSTVSVVTLAFCLGNTRMIRYAATFSSAGWLVYNAHHLSFAGAITEAFVLVSLIIAFWRFDIRKQKSEQ